MGIFFIILSGLSLIIPSVILIIYSHKMWSLINDSIVKEIKCELNSSSDVESFKTENGEYVNFFDEYFIHNQEIVYYENCIFMAVANSHKKPLSNMIYISLLVQYKDKKILIKLNRNLLNIIRNDKNIILSNREDLEYFMNNIKECSKKLFKLANISFQPYIILLFNKERTGKKYNIERIFISIVLIVSLLLGYGLLILSLNSEGTIKIIESNIGIIIFRIIVSIIILSLSFIKASNIKWYVRLSFPLYLVLYWIGTLFINDIFNYIVLMFSTIYFIVLGISQMDFEKINEQPFNRSLGFSMFLILVLMREAFDFNMSDGDAVFIIPGIIGGITLLASISILMVLYSKKKNENGFNKGNFLGSGLSLCFLIPLFTLMILVSDLILLNYCFDNSEPIYYEETIIRLEDGDDYESDKAIVLIENEEVELSISSSEHFEFKIGDILIISKYKGAFGYSYYVIEELK